MTQAGRPSVHSQRNSSLSRKFRNKDYRHSYVSSHTKTFLANQLRAFRGKMSQGEFGRKIGKPQPVVNRNENASYGKFSLQNLLEIAEKLDVAVHVRFVDFPTFIELTEDLSEAALKPKPYAIASASSAVVMSDPVRTSGIQWDRDRLVRNDRSIQPHV